MDRFIFQQLEESGLTPAPDADPVTLVRRIYFDLIGLPPSPEVIESLGHAVHPEATAQLIDRLLASPAFGERWGRHWLDVVRFGESVTLRGLVFTEAWRYRDYVIDAFNQDRPFDQFIREQIAGDLLTSDDLAVRRQQIIATTFLALGNTVLEEQDKEQLRMDVVDEQLDTIGKAFLAQTLGCARCHDHKFDPIPTSDYYALAGILRNTTTITNANVSGWLELPLPVEPEQEKIYREHEAKLAPLQAEISAAKNLAKASPSNRFGSKGSTDFVPQVVRATELPGLVVDSAQAKSVGAWTRSIFSGHYIGDGFWHDGNTDKGGKTLTFQPDIREPGRYEVRLAYVPAPNRATNVPVTVFHADGETTLPINQQETPPIDRRFVSLGVFRFEANGFGYVLIANGGTTAYVTADAVQLLPVEGTAAGSTALKSREVRIDPPPNSQPDPGKLQALEAQLKNLEETGPRRPRSMAVRDADRIEDTFIHRGGSVHRLGARVPRGFLQVATRLPVPAFSDRQSGRRELADWIAARENPLTARVIVNRVWHWLFGVGLVRTTDNFGTQGETPSHPELLDYLAQEFMSRGWSIKQLVREIMLSRVYQLGGKLELSASHGTRGSMERDPENRLLGHSNRRRLNAECLRDALLQISGELVDERGGRSFQRTLAADYGFRYLENRRSVYVPAFRNSLPEIFEVFDFADPSMVVGARNTSTVVSQALFFLNHPFVRTQASAAAKRLLAETKSQADPSIRIRRAYLRVLGRVPTAGEIALAQKVLDTALEPEEAWVDIIQALFASADFRYLN